MGQANEPTIRIPFRYVSGIPRQAAIEIFRDFEEITRHLNSGTASVYDAIIDPILAVSDPTRHLYVNFTELIAGEGVQTNGFNIGVVPRAFATITEPGSISFVGWSHVNICSIAPAATEGVSVSNAASWAMPAVNMASGQIISMSGMHIPSGSSSTGFFGFAGLNIILLNECWIGSGINVSPGSLYATDCYIGSQHITSGSTSDNVILHDCTWFGAINLGGINQFHMLGGYLNGALTTTGHITAGFYMECAIQGQVQLDHVEGGVVNNLGSSAGTFFSIGSHVTGACIVTGAWNEVWIQGSGIRVDVRLTAADANPALQLTSVTDSLITVTFAPAATGAQAYTIDAASARNLIVASGLHNTLFTVASTNAGTACRVIDELGTDTTDSARKDMVPGELFGPVSGVQTLPAAATGGGAPSGPATGSLGGSYPGPTFAGRDSSVDEINKDILPAELLGIGSGPMGVQVYGHAPESALAQKSDLSGTWPNMQVTGFAGKKVSATAPNNNDLMLYSTAFNVGWVSSSIENTSKMNPDFTKDFMLMGG